MEQFLAGLDDLLTKLAQAQDSETIRNATSVLNTQYYVTADCVPALVEVVARSPHFQVRQLAAVELRKRTNKWWSQIQESVKVNLRAQLLTIALNEQNDSVRHSIARVISTVAGIDMPDNKWPALLEFLHQSCSSQSPAHREIGLYCLYTLFEVIADFFMNNTTSLFELFNKTIVDQESKSVRITTVLVLGKLSEFVDSEDKSTIKMFRAIIPSMVNVLEQCIKDGDTDNASKIFEVFDTLLMLDAPLLFEHLAHLIDFFLTVGSDTTLDDEMRVLALSFLMWAAVYKQHKIRQMKLVGHIVEKLMPIGTEEDPEDVDEDSPSRLAFKVLNALATNIPPQQVFPIVMPFVLSYVQNPDPRFRKAAMMAFAVTVEGCTDIISTKLNELLPLVCGSLQDPEIIVRRAACMALGCLADEMPSDVSEHHQVLLPLVFNLMNDNNAEVTKHACNALDAILDGLGSDIIQYLPLLMEKLLFLLDNANQNETRATVIAAIGSAAHAAGEAFHPYFLQVLPRIVQFMSTKEPADDHLLRSVATDAAGSIAEAVGADAFRPYTQDIMNLAIEQLHLESARLRECSFALFSNLVRVFGEEFAPFLPTIVPEIISTCKAEEKSEAAVEEEIDLTTGGVDDELEDEFENFSFNSPLADEKEFAVDALGELFANTKSHFLPYLETSLAELQKLSSHLFDGVRKSATQSLFTFLKTAYTMSNPTAWVSGVPASYTVHENVQTLINSIVPMTIELWKEEDDRSVAAQICLEFVAALRLMGPIVVNECLEDICNNLLEIYQKKSLCQQAFDEGDFDEEDDDLESEAMLISSASDLVAALCETVGPNFTASFEVFLPYILKYYKPTKSQTERAMAVGCLGECIVGIKSAITPHTERLLQVFVKACSDEDELVRSNAAFALGCLTIHTQVDLSAHYPALLTALSPLFNNQTLPNTTDNAAGAVARMIIAHPEAVPLDQVLPVFINALPLKADYEENQPVFECIFKLFGANNAYVFNNLPQFLHIFAQVLSDNEQLKEGTRNHLIELIRALNTQRPDLSIASSELARFL
ncbi:ARM repeat-containing protein [Rhizopus microsporus var. microsporus]|uniref:ARM repeat-containing protein n=2 Tax=Rhizopus microsporus TaxID=58291 RepID=A0A2G4SQR1_RHIZD|nr:ARM repeat-containing protein [Rhizopus microsporus ATCC 52813]ORE08465.1 ARM repeat-containing protein [Rhizopus microsporus var. microsporus]PHZ11127.1 ARM repeat-containing protein [Rhizopus microsporus ATCC 52813]